jgi:hypothetical protein
VGRGGAGKGGRVSRAYKQQNKLGRERTCLHNFIPLAGTARRIDQLFAPA